MTTGHVVVVVIVTPLMQVVMVLTVKLVVVVVVGVGGGGFVLVLVTGQVVIVVVTPLMTVTMVTVLLPDGPWLSEVVFNDVCDADDGADDVELGRVDPPDENGGVSPVDSTDHDTTDKSLLVVSAMRAAE